MPDEPMHKCIDCGFLSLMRGDTDRLTEASDSFRHIFYDRRHGQPWCFMRRRFLTQDYLDLKLKAGVVRNLHGQINLDAVNPDEFGFVNEIDRMVAEHQTLNEDTAICKWF